MARISIYIPDELKERMDEVEKDGPALNWSAVVRPAILTAIAETTKKRSKDMSAVIDRLRASKARWEQSSGTTFHDAGTRWAMETADWAQLERVVNIEYLHLSANDLWDEFRAALDPDKKLDTLAILKATGLLESHDALVAFLGGVIEVYAEVEHKV